MVRWILFVLCGVLVAAAQEMPAERKKLADEAYKARMAFVSDKRYNPYGSVGRDCLAKANQLCVAGDFKAAIAKANEGLEAEPFNIRLLMLVASALRESKDVAAADKCRARWMALADSIVYHGDGRSFATAWTVIAVDEEYAVLELLGCERGEQFLQEHEGSQYDVLNVKHRKSGTELTLYFNIDAPMRHLSKTLGGH